MNSTSTCWFVNSNNGREGNIPKSSRSCRPPTLWITFDAPSSTKTTALLKVPVEPIRSRCLNTATSINNKYHKFTKSPSQISALFLISNILQILFLIPQHISVKTLQNDPSLIRLVRAMLIEKCVRWALATGGILTSLSCLMTFGLWVPTGTFQRTLPNIPISPFIVLPSSIHMVLAVTTLLLLPMTITIACLKSKSHVSNLVWIQLILFVLIVAIDVTRLQTWLYIYLMLLFVTNSCSPSIFQTELRTKEHEVFATLTGCRIIVASVWLYSGLLKFNPNYPKGDFSFIMPWTEYVPEQFLSLLAYASATGECALGLSLIVLIGLENNQLGMLMVVVGLSAIGMHVFISIRLLMLSYEIAVIPWNLCFISYSTFYFVLSGKNLKSKRRRKSKNRILKSKNRILWFITVLFMILPALNLVNMYDSYLSFSMYTTNDPSFFFVTPFKPTSKIARYRFHSCALEIEELTADRISNHWEWGFKDTGASVYPALWVFDRIVEKTCPVDDGIFVIIDKHAFPYRKVDRMYRVLVCSNGVLTRKEWKQCL